MCFVRDTTTIDLARDARKRIDDYVAKRGARGMKKFVLSKLVKWFADQPDPVKSVILGWVDEGMEKQYAQFLRKLARELDPLTGEIRSAPSALQAEGIEVDPRVSRQGRHQLREAPEHASGQ